MSFQELCDLPLLAGYVIVLAVVLGAVFGSFLNCMAWRMVHHESVLKGRSHCASCGHPLKAADLVPVFSYLFLKGKCRYCGEKISPRYMAAELVSAALWLGCVFRYGV
ncbi:MAG: prepilin peptidase, partial [Firmicutes bacterium]|nr:prepilin peptidase [Bacillota bacterium]